MTNIPETWRLVVAREGRRWCATASKREGVREIAVSTYDCPQETFEACMELLEERIKQ